MTAIVNGIQYIGGGTAPDEFIKNQAGTIDGTQTVENGVLAGPITIPCLLYTSPSPRDRQKSRMPSSA